MNGKGFGLVAVLIAIVAAGVYFFVGDLNSLPVKDVVRDTSTTTDTASSSDDRQDTSEFVRVAHVYENGTHTLTGEINLPTPCHTLSDTVFVAESFPEQVTVQFVTTSASEMCAQVITPEPFSVSFDASEQASIRFTLNGEKLDYIITDSESKGDQLKDVIEDEESSTTDETVEEEMNTDVDDTTDTEEVVE